MKRILKHGFQFDFMDGATKVGSCEINETVAFDFMNEILARIDLIEDEKKELQTFTNSIEIDNPRPSPEVLRTLFKYINDYPYLFKLLLTLNRKIALEYLDKYFFKIPIQSNAVYHSHLSFFIYHLKNDFGEIKFLDFLSNLPLDVKDNELFKSALDEVN